MVIIDGVIRTMKDINYADIETIQVLKDAASTAIYGSKASRGIVMITTKQGKAGKGSISFSYGLSVAHYSLNIFSEIPFYRLSLYISYLLMFSFGLNTHEISRF